MNSLLLLTMFAVAAQPGFEDGAPVLRAAAFEGQLAEGVAPTAAVWDGADAYQIPLRMTPPHPGSEEMLVQSIDTLEVRALAAADGIAIRIAWDDATANFPPSQNDETGRFPDAVAVQFPAGTRASVLPALAMGAPEKKVNIWRWVAGSETAEEGVAEGFGNFNSVQGATPVNIAGSRTGGGWAVTLWRPYEVESEVIYPGNTPGTQGEAERAAIERGARVPCAFAVWNGAYENRGGLKAVSIWYYLQLPTR
jgi:complex iron-sulfur molybdoenzyme family reductase subunit gamma